MSTEDIYDVAIIGGGIAGSCAAHLLIRAGYRVALIDQRKSYPSCFKAEKIEPDQVALFRKFNLFEFIEPCIERIREVLVVRNGRLSDRLPIEQYGMAYHDLVNAIRNHFPKELHLKINRVLGIESAAGESTLTLQDGEKMRARLIVLAAGTGGTLYKDLGIARNTIQDQHSLCFGFTIAAQDGRPFPFDSITIYPKWSRSSRIAYATLFKTRAGMRVNFFTYWKAKEEKVRTFIAQPLEQLQAIFPGMSEFVGPAELTGKVEACPIDLFVADIPKQSGLVLAADSFQSVCPTTGLGLSKVLTDIELLCHSFIPAWLSSNDTSAERISEFYAHSTKQDVDSRSLTSAYRQRQVGSSGALRWKLRRSLISLKPRLPRAIKNSQAIIEMFARASHTTRMPRQPMREKSLPSLPSKELPPKV